MTRFRPFVPSGRWFPSRRWLPSLPKPDVRERLTDLRYAITDRLHDAADRATDLVAAGWHAVTRRLTQLSSVQIVAIVGVLLALILLAYGWGFYELLHPKNGVR